MRQTLFVIPETLYGWPVFGLGVLLAAWIVIALVRGGWLARDARAAGRPWFDEDVQAWATLAAIVAAGIAVIAPMLIDRELKGLPVRGFGVALMVAVVSAFAFTERLANRMGVESDVIFSMAGWVFICGIAGARLFHVIEYWPRFQRPTIWETLKAIVNVPEGGIVLYGSVIGGLIGASIFFWRRRLPALPILDLIAPGLALGVAIGRIGCLMNGCCFGGECSYPFAVRFPENSVPYARQLETGRLYGVDLATDETGRAGIPVRAVVPGSVADRAGLKSGDTIIRAEYVAVATRDDLLRRIAGARRQARLEVADGRTVDLPLDAIPRTSLPIHATQIYDAVNSLFIFLSLAAYYPLRRGDGQVAALFLVLYPVARIVIETIRVDEPGQFGTELSISQWLSFGMLLASIALWTYAERSGRPLLPMAPAENAEPATSDV